MGNLSSASDALFCARFTQELHNMMPKLQKTQYLYHKESGICFQIELTLRKRFNHVYFQYNLILALFSSRFSLILTQFTVKTQFIYDFCTNFNQFTVSKQSRSNNCSSQRNPKPKIVNKLNSVVFFDKVHILFHFDPFNFLAFYILLQYSYQFWKITPFLTLCSSKQNEVHIICNRNQRLSVRSLHH